jgi:hypothetical protein
MSVQGLLGVSAGTSQGDSNLVRVETIQYVSSTYPSVIVDVTENNSYGTA